MRRLYLAFQLEISSCQFTEDHKKTHKLYVYICVYAFFLRLYFFFFSLSRLNCLKSRNTESRLHTHTVSEEKAKWRRRIQSIQRRLQSYGKFKNAAISQWAHSRVSNLEMRFFASSFPRHFKRHHIRFGFCLFFTRFEIISTRTDAREIHHNSKYYLLSPKQEKNNTLCQCKCVFVSKGIVVWSFIDRWHVNSISFVHSELI